MASRLPNSTVLRWTLGIIGTAILAVVFWLCSTAFGHESRITRVESDYQHIQEDLKCIQTDMKDGFKEVQQAIKELGP